MGFLHLDRSIPLQFSLDPMLSCQYPPPWPPKLCLFPLLFSTSRLRSAQSWSSLSVHGDSHWYCCCLPLSLRMLQPLSVPLAVYSLSVNSSFYKIIHLFIHFGGSRAPMLMGYWLLVRYAPTVRHVVVWFISCDGMCGLNFVNIFFGCISCFKISHLKNMFVYSHIFKQ